jgi:signal transduction histidine kinase
LHNAPQSDQELDAQARERLALTAKLHETIAQDLALMGYRVDELIADNSLTSNQRSLLRELRLSILQVNKRFRDVIYSPMPRNRDLLLKDLRDVLGNLHGDIDLSFPRLKDHEEDMLGDVLVEMARNSVRHSQARNFHIAYEISQGNLSIHVSDDGEGMPSISNPNLGIRIIDQTLKLLCHTYSCHSDVNGTRYSLLIKSDAYENSSNK